MAKLIVYSRTDGGVSVVSVAPSNDEDAAIAAEMGKTDVVPPSATNVEIMEQSILPPREFRDAWEKLGAGAPTINMPKARIIHAGRINAAKTKAVTMLQRRADEATLEGRTADATKAANDKAAVEGLNLTTIATQIAGAPNPVALSAIWPVELQEFKS